MPPYALTLNAGSSSIKFGAFALGADEPELTLIGQVDRIGGDAHIKAKLRGETVSDAAVAAGAAADHAGALGQILAVVERSLPGVDVPVVGHRIAHGGQKQTGPVVLNDAVLEELAQLTPFVPLHQPHNIAGVRAAQAAFPSATQVGCFDTAFHRKHPFVNDVFAIPREYYNKGVRRYGFHGLSYDYIAGKLRSVSPEHARGRVVVAHLGNGASMCAMHDGQSVGSTMGFSALDGLPMGTRCGQLDPGVLLYLMETEGLSPAELSDLLYKRSGLLGLSELSNDMRELEAADTLEARQAIDYFVFRVRRELGAMAAVLNGIDAIVFTGGIGENSRLVRRRVCGDLAWLGVHFDNAANDANETVITAANSTVRVFVLETNEELVIARACAALLETA